MTPLERSRPIAWARGRVPAPPLRRALFAARYAPAPQTTQRLPTAPIPDDLHPQPRRDRPSCAFLERRFP
jgi:hypothetical protein